MHSDGKHAVSCSSVDHMASDVRGGEHVQKWFYIPLTVNPTSEVPGTGAIPVVSTYNE